MGSEITFEGKGLRLLLLALVAAAAGTAILSLAPRSDAALPVCPRVGDVDPCDPGGGEEEPGFVDVAVTTSPAGTSGDPAWDDQDLTYNVTVSNTDGVTDASGVTLTSELVTGQANHVSSNPSQGSCTGTGTVTCNLGTIAAGGSVTVAIAVRPSAGTLKHRFTTDSADLSGDLVDKTTTVRASAPSAAMDWSMPPRARDDNDDGLLDTAPPAGGYAPSSWTVTLNGCGSSGGRSAISTYKWEVRGLPEQITSNCSHTLQVPQEKIYPTKLTITTADGQTRTAERDVRVQDRLIVMMGDSYGSGEGVPHTFIQYHADLFNPSFTPPTWADTRCHRSSWAASARAARMLELEDPRSSVTYVSKACSGATIAEGIVGPYKGIEPPSPITGPCPAPPAPSSPCLPPQVEQVRTEVGANTKIDDLVLSIGGNDVGFANIIAKCIEHSNCHTRSDTAGAFDTALAGLPNHYLAMRQMIEDRLEVASTYVTEYPDFTTDSDGSRCNDIGSDILFDIVAIDATEATWASQHVLGNLISALQAEVTKAQQAGLDWNYVGGVAAAWTENGQGGHGYCVGAEEQRDPDRWVRTFTDSCDLQGPPAGFNFGQYYCHADKTFGHFHPNEQGHFATAQQYLPVMRGNPPAVAPADAPGGGGGDPGDGGGDPGDGGGDPGDGGGDGGGNDGGSNDGGGGNTTTGGDTTNLPPLTNGSPTVGGNLSPEVTRGKPGRCSRLKGRRRARCVKRACARFNRGKRTAAKKKKYGSCVRAVTRKR